MLRCLGHDPAFLVKTFPPGAPGYLVKIPRAQDSHLLAIILRQAREEHRPDGDVDADAERVGAADDLEQPLLRELLHQDAVLRQQAGVMQTDPVLEPFPDVRSIRAGELEPFERAGDLVFLVTRTDVDAGEILRALGRFELRKVDDIHRRLPVGRETFQSFGQRKFRVGEFQRHRALYRSHRDRRSSVGFGQFLFKERRIAERGGHEQKTRVGQRQQRHLPGDAAVAIGVVVKLVHDHLLYIRGRSFAQCDVGEDLGGAAKDRRVPVHRRVTGAQADVVRAELAAKRHEFFVHERFDRARVNRALAFSNGFEVERGGDE